MSIKNIFNTQISMNTKEIVLYYYLQGICRIFKNQFKAIYDWAAQVKWTTYEWGWTISMVTYIKP